MKDYPQRTNRVSDSSSDDNDGNVPVEDSESLAAAQVRFTETIPVSETSNIPPAETISTIPLTEAHPVSEDLIVRTRCDNEPDLRQKFEKMFELLKDATSKFRTIEIHAKDLMKVCEDRGVVNPSTDVLESEEQIQSDATDVLQATRNATNRYDGPESHASGVYDDYLERLNLAKSRAGSSSATTVSTIPTTSFKRCQKMIFTWCIFT